MEPQKTLNRKKNEAGDSTHPILILLIYYSSSKQNGNVVASKQMHKPMKQDREPRNKPTFTMSVYF